MKSKLKFTKEEEELRCRLVSIGIMADELRSCVDSITLDLLELGRWRNEICPNPALKTKRRKS